jgi:hypothetical protein
MQPATAQGVAPVLRGRALEIVDEKGKVRADIKINPAETMPDCAVSQNPACGRTFPETVILHMSDPNGLIRVKLDASSDGSGFMLANDSQQPGVNMSAKGTGSFMRVTDKDGREQIVKP